MRRVLLTLLLALAAAPTAAVAQLPAPPVLPPVPPLPLPLPPLPAPAPTVPSIPAPVAPTLPSVPAPAAPAAPAAPTVPQAPAVATPTGSTSTPSAGSGQSGQTSNGTSAAPSQSSDRTAAPKRRPSVVLAFRASASGRTAIRLRQVAPVCRNAGRLLVPSRSGPNRFRFNGRVSGRPLRDGTYVATTPSGTVRFAIVKGKPTRNPRKLSPSVCDAETVTANLAFAAPISVSSPNRTEAAPAANIDRGATDEPGSLPQVLGTAFTDAAEAAASLHPAFYVLLGLAMAALAAAALPARVLPVATAGAVLARHRAAVTLAGTLCLLLVIVVYWATLL
jgi:hypothetical protein